MPTFGTHLVPPSMLGQFDMLQIGAVVLLTLAVGALALAIVAAWRQGGIAGLLATFGLARASESPPHNGTITELRGLMSEASELAETLAGNLDTRAERLEHLLDEADQKLRQLERGPARVRSHSATPVASSVIEATGVANIRHDDDPITREIYRLSDQGLPPGEIARSLGQHTGKVELILALRQS